MIDKEKLYLLPWTRDLNANGWIEPTTHCQLKCPFCYRGADLDGHRPEHMDLADVKKDVDDLIRLRRVGTITIAGGDALLYPSLVELIEYIRSRDVEVMVLTNGIALDEPMLETLKKAGAVRIVIHVDKHQARPGVDTEERANRIRGSFCELFRRVGGIALGFIQPIRYEDLDDLEVLIPFFKENSDVIDLVTFNRLLPVENHSSPPARNYDERDLFERFRDIYGLEYNAYLGKTHSSEIAWLFALVVYSGKHVLGCVDGRAFQIYQERCFRKTGRYVYSAQESPLPPGLVSYIPFNRSLRNLAFRYFQSKVGLNGTREGAGKIHIQRILLINPPRRLPSGELDRCKGCPDAMMYGGKLIPSCWLEQVRKGEDVEAG